MVSGVLAVVFFFFSFEWVSFKWKMQAFECVEGHGARGQ